MIIHKPILLNDTTLIPTAEPTLVTEGFPCSPFRHILIHFQEVAGTPWITAAQNMRVYFWFTIPGTAISGWFNSRWHLMTNVNDLDIIQSVNNIQEITVPRPAERIYVRNSTGTQSVYHTMQGWSDRKERLIKEI